MHRSLMSKDLSVDPVIFKETKHLFSKINKKWKNLKEKGKTYEKQKYRQEKRGKRKGGTIFLSTVHLMHNENVE